MASGKGNAKVRLFRGYGLTFAHRNRKKVFYIIDKKRLEDMSRVQISDSDPGRWKDILNVNITGETAVQRLESYLAQVGNPYCFRVGDTPVRISFREQGGNLEREIIAYFISLKA